MIQGVAKASWAYEEGTRGEKLMLSGDFFDYRMLNSLGIFVGFPNQEFRCVAAEGRDHPVVVFKTPLERVIALIEIAPTLQTFLRTYAMGVLAREVQARAVDTWSAYSFDSFGTPEV